MVSTNTRQEGRNAEALAASFLQTHGLELVMADGNSTLVFVEVRHRRSNQYGGAAASITAQKRSRIIRAAMFFLQSHGEWRDHRCRFDVIAIDGALDTSNVDWLQAAFTT